MNESTPDLDHVDVRYVANLARMELTEEEVPRLQGELDAVLAYIHQLNELELDGVEPMSHPQPRENVLREDEPRPAPDPDDMMRNAPATIQGLFRVPRMME